MVDRLYFLLIRSATVCDPQSKQQIPSLLRVRHPTFNMDESSMGAVNLGRIGSYDQMDKLIHILNVYFTTTKLMYILA